MSQIGSDLLAAGWHPKRDAVRSRAMSANQKGWEPLFNLGNFGGFGNPPSRPIRSIQRPVLDRLCDVLALDLRAGFHIGNGARDFQYPVMRSGAEALLQHGAFQHALAVSTQVAIGADLA